MIEAQEPQGELPLLKSGDENGADVEDGGGGGGGGLEEGKEGQS